MSEVAFDRALGPHLQLGRCPPASPSILAAQESDAAEITRLSRELGYQTTVEEIHKVLRHMRSSTDYLAVVASTGGDSLLGWAVAERRRSMESGEFVELTGLVVSASARRLGVGRALVAAAERWAQRNGFSSIRVRSNVTRAESHPFYESLGFERTKTQHAYKKIVSAPA